MSIGPFAVLFQLLAGANPAEHEESAVKCTEHPAIPRFKAIGRHLRPQIAECALSSHRANARRWRKDGTEAVNGALGSTMGLVYTLRGAVRALLMPFAQGAAIPDGVSVTGTANVPIPPGCIASCLAQPGSPRGPQAPEDGGRRCGVRAT